VRISSCSTSLRVRPGGLLQRVDVQLDLLTEQAVDGATQFEQLVDRHFSLVGAEVTGHLVDEQAVHAGVT
jgi:hypothetical protein